MSKECIHFFGPLCIWGKINLSASHLQGSTPEDGIDGLSQNVGRKSSAHSLCNNPEQRTSARCACLDLPLLGALVWTYLSAIVPRNLAEGLITVDNWEIDDLSVGQ